MLAFALPLTAAAPGRPAATPENTPRTLALDAGTPTGRLGRALAPSASDGSASAPSFESVLTPEGRISPEAKGSFSADGFVLDARPGEAPRFVRAGAEGAYSGAFRTNVNGNVRAIAVLSPTEFIVGGDFTNLAGNGAADYLGRWTGTDWEALGGGTDGSVEALAVSGSDVYVGGSFSKVYNGPGRTGAVSGTRSVARWTGTAWEALGGGACGSCGSVYALAVSGSNVYVGGQIAVSRWNGTAWQVLGGGTQGDVYALAVSGSDVYVGGSFSTVYNGPGEPGAVSGTHGVARWTGTAWEALGGGTSPGTVYALAVSGSNVYVGGVFENVYAGPGQTGRVAGTLCLARWTGTAWEALGEWINGPVAALAVSGSDVYVGGSFTSAYNGPSKPSNTGWTGRVDGTVGLARWSGTAWEAVGGGTSGSVAALTVSGSDVYVGGRFTTAYNGPGQTGGVTGSSMLARWNGSMWHAAVPPAGHGPNGPVRAIAVLSPTEFIVGGDFTNLAGTGTGNHVARWNGTAWQALGGGTDGPVYALAVSGSDVYVGGQFTTAYNGPDRTGVVAGTYGVARWTGSAWQALGGGTSGCWLRLCPCRERQRCLRRRLIL